jgi:hypothetical protein
VWECGKENSLLNPGYITIQMWLYLSHTADRVGWFCSHRSEKQDDHTPGPTGTLRGNHSGQAASRMEQRGRFGSEHGENRATGRWAQARPSGNDHTPIGHAHNRRAVVSVVHAGMLKSVARKRLVEIVIEWGHYPVWISK